MRSLTIAFMLGLTQLSAALAQVSLAQDNNFFPPVCPKGQQQIQHSYYQVCYNPLHRQANWTYHELTSDMVGIYRSRTDDYRADGNLSGPQVQGRDYRYSGYDRGHLVPAADMYISAEAMSESFYMSNMSPQEREFNRGIWAKLEKKVRTWAEQKGHLMIVTGPVLSEDLDQIDSGVSVPQYFFKLVLHYNFDNPELSEMTAFLMANEESWDPLTDFQTTVDEVEQITGFDFFPHLPQKIQKKLESQFQTELWFE